ncbi:MAG TPA: thiamine pyrophosphate-dependent enzyme [Acidimicrobiales bacterium]|nr:thiamine pyrophosphate-dependent enzyme [Acidimicrobiales bacterium]
MTHIPTDSAPDIPAAKVASSSAPLQLSEEHHLCPGCGHPVAWRLLLEVISELELERRAIGVVGHGCYTNIVRLADVDFLQCLHGRAPAVATGVKRVQPQAAVFTLQGDGDMASEGLQEVLHAAGRGERITCIMLNNGVFGDTGGQMTAATVVGQRTKTSLDGRDPASHGHPIPVADLVARLPGSVYVARGAVNNAGSIARTKRYLRRAFELQMEGAGFGLVEVLTMCPTGWFVATPEGPDYLEDRFEPTFPVGELKTA